MLFNILLVIAAIVVLFLIIAYIIPRKFSISKSVIINTPREQVYQYIARLENQKQYSVWLMRDPAVAITTNGTDGTVGARQAWVSQDKNVGAGEQEITSLLPNEKMTVEIRFEKPFKATNYADTTLETVGEQTKVVNTLYGTSKFPMNITNLFLDKMVGGDMQQNMENLKKIMEQK